MGAGALVHLTDGRAEVFYLPMCMYACMYACMYVRVVMFVCVYVCVCVVDSPR